MRIDDILRTWYISGNCMSLLEILELINEYFWYIPLVLIVCLGLYGTFKLKGIQIRDFKEMFKVTFSKEEHKKGTLSTLQVFCVSMGNRIGVGNITGPVMAITVGGPGAIFWMWIFAILGMASSAIETTIGQLYKVRGEDGEYHGGPAYTILNGLNMRRVAMFVAGVMILMYIVGFVSMEVSGMTNALCGAFDFEYNNVFFAILLTALTAGIIIGGLQRIANISLWLVPAMALLWLVLAVVSIALSAGGIVNAFVMIFQYAFNVPAAIGGTFGAMILIGMKRGVLSNEAGIGTITNVSSMADVEHPVKQGLSQSFGVLIDTVISTLTALVILSYGSIETIMNVKKTYDLDATNLLQYVLEDTIGGAAPYLVALFLFVFAFTCLMGDYVIGENNLAFITKNKKGKYAIIAILLAIVFLSSFYASDEIIAIVDILLAVCGVINCLVMFKLAGKAVELYHDYRAQKAAGKETPVFSKDILSDTSGITEWE